MKRWLLLVCLVQLCGHCIALQCTICDTACSGANRVCTKDADGVATCGCVSRMRGDDCSLPREKMLVFLTAAEYTPAEVSGATHADLLCQLSAPSGYEQKVFKAWFGAEVAPRSSEFLISPYQYVDYHGVPVSSRGWPPATLAQSINGNATQFWLNGNCSGWPLSTRNSSGAGNVAMLGRDAAADPGWLSGSLLAPCTGATTARLLCVQQEYYGGPCESLPCLNNGRCVTSTSTNTYRCECPMGFNGTLCEIDPCASNPCLNNGTCVHSQDGYQCTCPLNTRGARCQYTNPCLQTPCKNGGVCSWPANSTTHYACDCPLAAQNGYSGQNCTTCQPPFGDYCWGNSTCTPLSTPEHCGSCVAACNTTTNYCSPTSPYECLPYPCTTLDPCRGGMCINLNTTHSTCDCNNIPATGSTCETCIDPWSFLCPGDTQCTSSGCYPGSDCPSPRGCPLGGAI